MTTTDAILKAAGDLGKLIADHEASSEIKSVETALKDDLETQRLLNDFERHAHKLNEKQQNNQPIEVAEKHKLQEYQQALGSNLLVQRLQKTQMNYLDLLRKVNIAIAEATNTDDDTQGNTQPPT